VRQLQVSFIAKSYTEKRIKVYAIVENILDEKRIKGNKIYSVKYRGYGEPLMSGLVKNNKEN
jgi:hypothetical protein